VPGTPPLPGEVGRVLEPRIHSRKGWAGPVFPYGRKETLVAMGDPDGSAFDKDHRLITTASVWRAVVAVQADRVDCAW
jgi:hypothetical protein